MEISPWHRPLSKITERRIKLTIWILLDVTWAVFFNIAIALTHFYLANKCAGANRHQRQHIFIFDIFSRQKDHRNFSDFVMLFLDFAVSLSLG